MALNYPRLLAFQRETEKAVVVLGQGPDPELCLPHYDVPRQAQRLEASPSVGIQCQQPPNLQLLGIEERLEFADVDVVTDRIEHQLAARDARNQSAAGVARGEPGGD